VTLGLGKTGVQSSQSANCNFQQKETEKEEQRRDASNEPLSLDATRLKNRSHIRCALLRCASKKTRSVFASAATRRLRVNGA